MEHKQGGGEGGGRVEICFTCSRRHQWKDQEIWKLTRSTEKKRIKVSVGVRDIQVRIRIRGSVGTSD
jgi:hypothetical protein